MPASSRVPAVLPILGAVIRGHVSDPAFADPSSAPVGIPTMVDVKYVDNLRNIVDAVADPVSTAPRSPLAGKRCAEASADPAGVPGQRTEHELHARGCGGFGHMLGELSG